MRESLLSASIRQKIKNKGTFTRIENVATPGIPDVHFFNGKDIWIELKIAKGNFIYFRMSQITWMRNRHKYNGNVVIICRKDNELLIAHSDTLMGDTCSNLLQYKGGSEGGAIHVNDFKRYGKTFKKPFNWEHIIELIVS